MAKAEYTTEEAGSSLTSTVCLFPAHRADPEISTVSNAWCNVATEHWNSVSEGRACTSCQDPAIYNAPNIIQFIASGAGNSHKKKQTLRREDPHLRHFSRFTNTASRLCVRRQQAHVTIGAKSQRHWAFSVHARPSINGIVNCSCEVDLE